MTALYLHPITAAATLCLLGYAAALGFRLRSARRDRAALARRHRRAATIVYWTVLASWVAGVGSTLWGRDDLAVASTLHFRTGAALGIVLTGSALTARSMDRGSVIAREVHPWLGAAAVLLAAAHVAAGLAILP
jgi:hypothetical protein